MAARAKFGPVPLGGLHEKTLQDVVPCIWRATDLLLPVRATSSLPPLPVQGWLAGPVVRSSQDAIALLAFAFSVFEGHQAQPEFSSG